MTKRNPRSSAFTLVSKHYYGCAHSRNKGTRDNRMAVKREDLESRFLGALKD